MTERFFHVRQPDLKVTATPRPATAQHPVASAFFNGSGELQFGNTFGVVGLNTDYAVEIEVNEDEEKFIVTNAGVYHVSGTLEISGPGPDVSSISTPVGRLGLIRYAGNGDQGVYADFFFGSFFQYLVGDSGYQNSYNVEFGIDVPLEAGGAVAFLFQSLDFYTITGTANASGRATIHHVRDMDVTTETGGG